MRPVEWSSRLFFRATVLTVILACVPSLLASQAKTAEPQSTSGNGATAKPRVWLDSDGKPLPFSSDAEVMEFLRKAKVKSSKNIPVGVTGPQKMLLEKDGVRANAHLNTVEVEKPFVTLADGRREIGFRDSYRYNGAAYALALLLGFDNVPPSVERTVSGQAGSLTIWIENTFTEKDRMAKKLAPPKPQTWTHQLQNMYVFDNLIYNTDRNQGNILIDPEWKVWMIDHTRAFRRYDDLFDASKIEMCGRSLYQRLKELSDEEIKLRLKPHLTGAEINAILKRRPKVIAHIEKLIQEKTEIAVLFRED